MSPLPENNIYGVEIPPAHSISDYIDSRTLIAKKTQLQFPQDRPKYYTQLAFSEYTFRTGTGDFNFQGPGDPRGDMVLPLPVNLNDVHKVKWDEKPILSWVKAFQEYAGVASTGLGVFGLAPGYFQTVLFDRPEYKRHELTFKLAPNNYAEAQEIRDIIIYINNAMSPTVQGKGAIFGFPNIVRVTFRPNAGFLYKFKPCVIEDFAINYAGGGGKKAFFHQGGVGGGGGDNPPESVEFTMHLLEIEYWINNSTSSNDQGQFNKADGP